MVFIEQHALENIVCKITAILFRPKCAEVTGLLVFFMSLSLPKAPLSNFKAIWKRHSQILWLWQLEISWIAISKFEISLNHVLDRQSSTKKIGMQLNYSEKIHVENDVCYQEFSNLPPDWLAACCKPIRSQVWKFLLADTDFNMDFSEWYRPLMKNHWLLNDWFLRLATIHFHFIDHVK